MCACLGLILCTPVMTSQRDASSDAIGYGPQIMEAILAFQAQFLIHF